MRVADPKKDYMKDYIRYLVYLRIPTASFLRSRTSQSVCMPWSIFHNANEFMRLPCRTPRPMRPLKGPDFNDEPKRPQLDSQPRGVFGSSAKPAIGVHIVMKLEGILNIVTGR